MKLFYCAAAALAVALPATLASAAMFDSVDGTINGGEYQVVNHDSGDAGTVFDGTSRDIDTASFAVKNVSSQDVLYFAFDTVTGPFDTGTSGNPMLVSLKIYDDSAPLTGYTLNFLFEGSSTPVAMAMTSGLFTPITVNSSDWAATAGDDFEAGILASYLPSVNLTGPNPSFSYTLTVGNYGDTHIDQMADSIVITVPEPATLALFGLGTAMMVSHRRRKYAA